MMVQENDKYSISSPWKHWVNGFACCSLVCEYENLEIEGVLLGEAEKKQLCAQLFHDCCNIELHDWNIWTQFTPNSVDRNGILCLFL